MVCRRLIVNNRVLMRSVGYASTEVLTRDYLVQSCTWSVDFASMPLLRGSMTMCCALLNTEVYLYIVGWKSLGGSIHVLPLRLEINLKWTTQVYEPLAAVLSFYAMEGHMER
jgi:hypothetical protein